MAGALGPDLPRRRRIGGAVPVLLALAFSLLAPGGTARAEDPWEVWPELNAFVRLDPRARLHLAAAYSTGKDTPADQFDVAAYFDLSLEPILRPVRRQEDWERNRFVWARVGYVHAIKDEGEGPYTFENRGVASLYAKEELPWQIWTEGRARADLRWIGGDYSTRYRLRVEVNREFAVLRHPVTPYFNVEWLYDTRYDGWSRVYYQAGSEVTLERHFRLEGYVGRQVDDLPKESGLYSLGAVVKFYF